MPSEEEETKKYLKVKNLHLAAAIFFLIQFIAYSATGATANVSPTVGVPNSGSECDGPLCGTTQKNLVPDGTNIAFLIPLFVGLACCDHFACYFYCHYCELSARSWLFAIGSNPFRWLEYGISASVMALAIAILAGITDVHLWFSTFMFTTVGIGCGAILELLPKHTWAREDHVVSLSTIKSLCFWLGSVAIFTPWLIIICYFFRAASSEMPDFVYAAFLGTLLLFTTFGMNSYFHNICNKYDFSTAEVIYIVLSFTAKTFLAADVFGGLNASNN